MADNENRGASASQIGCGVFIGLVLFFFVLPMAMCGGCAMCGVAGVANQEAERAQREQREAERAARKAPAAEWTKPAESVARFKKACDAHAFNAAGESFVLRRFQKGETADKLGVDEKTTALNVDGTKAWVVNSCVE